MDQLVARTVGEHGAIQLPVALLLRRNGRAVLATEAWCVITEQFIVVRRAINVVVTPLAGVDHFPLFAVLQRIGIARRFIRAAQAIDPTITQRVGRDSYTSTDMAAVTGMQTIIGHLPILAAEGRFYVSTAAQFCQALQLALRAFALVREQKLAARDQSARFEARNSLFFHRSG